VGKPRDYFKKQNKSFIYLFIYFAQVIASWPKVPDAKMAPVWITSAIVTTATEAAAALPQVKKINN
jgi:hypothetical protein